MEALISLSKLMFLTSLCCFILASVAQNGDQIQAICKKSRNPNFCFEFYKNDHGATVQDLALKAINNAEHSGYRTYDLLDSLVKETTDPTLRGKYLSCQNNYYTAILMLTLASRSLNDPKVLNDKVFNAQYAIAACNKGLGGIPGIGGRPVQPPKLNAGNEEISNLCSIAIIISNIL